MKNRRSDSRLRRGRTLDVSLHADPLNYTLKQADSVERVSVKHPCAVRLDQGREGACVGFGAAHWYACLPWAQLTTERIAKFFYEGAKEHDERPGTAYEGTSPNGLFTFLRRLGLIGKFWQIRSYNEVCKALNSKGPLMMAAPWKDGCFEPDADGTIHYKGETQGGHFVTINGVDYEHGYFWIVQSWGREHGIDGEVKLPAADLRAMLRDGALIYWAEELSLASLQTTPRRSFWSRLIFWK